MKKPDFAINSIVEESSSPTTPNGSTEISIRIDTPQNIPIFNFTVDSNEKCQDVIQRGYFYFFIFLFFYFLFFIFYFLFFICLFV